MTEERVPRQAPPEEPMTPPPMTPVTNFEVTYVSQVITTSDPRSPVTIIEIQQDGSREVTQVVGQFKKTIEITKNQLLNLPSQHVTIIPDPGNGKSILVDKAVWRKSSRVPLRTQGQGYGFPTISFGDGDSGFLSSDFNSPDYYLDLQALDGQRIVLGDDKLEGTLYPGSQGEGELHSGMAIKLKPVVQFPGRNEMGDPLTDQQTWEGLINRLPDGYVYTLKMFYNIDED